MDKILKILENHKNFINKIKRVVDNNPKAAFGAISIRPGLDDERKIGYHRIDHDPFYTDSDKCYGVVVPIGCILKEVEPRVYLIVKEEEDETAE